MRALWLVLGVVLAAVGSDGGLATRDDDKQNFELKEVLDGSFSAKGLGAVWVAGDKLARYNTSKGIEICGVSTSGDCTVLVSSETLALGERNKGVGSWKLSSDQKLLLWSYDVQSVFRHSTAAKYSVLDIQENEWYDLKDPTASDEENSHLKAALLAGGQSVFFVSQNNIIYYVDDIATSEPSSKPLPVPCGGKKDVYYCGIPDWVYEEEVLSSGTAMWLSKESSYLAYGIFDDTKVKDYTYIYYGDEQYTDKVTLKYPKPGTDNPVVKLGIVKKPGLSVNYHYSPPVRMDILQHVSWISDKVLLVVWMSRIQNAVTVELIDLKTSIPERITVFTDEENSGWLEVGTPVAISEKSWVQLLPRKTGTGSDRFQRPVVFVDEELQENADRTSGALEATVLYGWDSVSNRIFFQAAPENTPSQRHVYSASTTGNVDVKCLTCEMEQNAEDELCLYASASFSTDMRNVAVTCSGPGPAVVRLAAVSDNGELKWGRNWEENNDLRDKLRRYNTPVVETNITIDVAQGFGARARLWLPFDINRSGSRKYPMLVYVYGGPGSQQVSDAYSVNWGTHLAGSKNIIYASIDGRGSGYQGTKYLYTLYKKLGTVEVLDQISAVKELIKRYPFIDEDRVGIWGWSYGGYATAMALAKDTDNVFKCGASVAPVTDWMLYDSIYTERYMDIPEENEEGYKAAKITNEIEEFKNHSFFLLHGNADDNVHYQQAMRLARALELGDILFYEQSYPDENHSIRSVITHVYKSLDRFFDQCFEAPSSSAAMVPSMLFILLVASIMRIFS